MDTQRMSTAGALALPADRVVRERWIAAVAALLAATVFALFVIVLEQDVQRAGLARAQAQARAEAAAQCAGDQRAYARASCEALLQGGTPGATVAAQSAQPENDLDEHVMRRSRDRTGSLATIASTQ